MNLCPDAGRLVLTVLSRSFYFILPSVFIPFNLVKGQCTLVCNSGTQISLSENGQFLLTSTLFAPTAANLCPGSLELTVWTGPGQVLTDNIATCEQAGQSLIAQVRHTASGNFCQSEVEINDFMPPVISCPPRFINCSQNPDPAEIGLPLISDNCTPFNLLEVSFFDQNTPMPCGSSQSGIPVRERIDRLWQVKDAQNNQSTCLEKIWLQGPAIDSVAFPSNLDDFSLPALVCGQDPTDLQLTGAPTIFGNPINNNGPCEMGVAHADQTIPGCSPGNYVVLRTWTVIDFCTNAIRQRIQVIKIEDDTPPILGALPLIVAGSNETDCEGTVLLPIPMATDDCSSVSVTANWAFGSGPGPFTNVPKGQHIVMYTATDGCGNTATATTFATVVDDDPPQVICATSLQISLGANGHAIINTAALDAGSWDNCGANFKLLSRNDSVWTATTALSCADENTPVAVSLRVTDAEGLSNFCQVQVTARDFLKPTITCPANISLNCLQDPLDITLTGDAIATDNCTVDSISYTDSEDLSACNTGTIIRQWKATDLAGNTKTCSQTITLHASLPLSVEFPVDITLNSCSSALNLAPSSTGMPVFTGTTCFEPTVNYTDQLFNIAAPACFVVMRTWKVYDLCVYSPSSNGNGYWEHTQQINVTDQTPPQVILPQDATISSGPGGCNAWVDLPDIFVSDCNPAVTVSHNSLYAQQGWNASGWYPPGTHHITFVVNDGCGNSVMATFNLVVVDLLPPVAVCLNGLSVNLSSSGWVNIAPAMFDGGSSDNCSTNLLFEIAPQGFSCQHLGQQQVTLSVTDAAGNTGSCLANLSVQDNQQICSRYTISGFIRNPEGAPVPGIKVDNGLGEAVLTDSFGYYRFDSLAAGKNYLIKPHHNGNWLNGITAYDFVLISRHILNLEPIGTPASIIAADINNSGTVTTYDIVQIRKVLLGTLDTVPEGKSWRFIPASFTFINPSNPFSPMFPEAIAITGLDTHKTGLDFVAIKTGDIDHTSDPVLAISGFEQRINSEIAQIVHRIGKLWQN